MSSVSVTRSGLRTLRVAQHHGDERRSMKRSLLVIAGRGDGVAIGRHRAVEIGCDRRQMRLRRKGISLLGRVIGGRSLKSDERVGDGRQRGKLASPRCEHHGQFDGVAATPRLEQDPGDCRLKVDDGTSGVGNVRIKGRVVDAVAIIRSSDEIGAPSRQRDGTASAPS